MRKQFLKAKFRHGKLLIDFIYKSVGFTSHADKTAHKNVNYINRFDLKIEQGREMNI